MRGDERRQGRREACRCTSVNGGDSWRPACNSDAFRMVWVEGIRLGGPDGEFGRGGTMRRVTGVIGMPFIGARECPCAVGISWEFKRLNRNRSLPVDKSSDLAAPEAVLKGCKGDRPVTVHRSGDMRFFTESVDKYVNSVRANPKEPVFMRVLRVLPKI